MIAVDTDVRTSMRYQHPVLDSVREAIDQRNLRHNPRHNELSVTVKARPKCLKEWSRRSDLNR